MSHAVENMAYTGEVPWHGLGVSVGSDLTPKQMLKAAKLDWTVSKRQVFHDVGGTMTAVPGAFALARDTDNSVLSMVGASYKPVQNEQAMDFFDKFTRAGQMTMETAGSLWGGRYIWGLARTSKDFTLGKKDEVRGYLLLSQPHVFGYSMVIQFTPIRVVCWNTLNMALGANLRGGKSAFRMPHSVSFDDSVKKKATEALGLANDQMDAFKEAATLLSKKKATPEKVDEYFNEVLKFDPRKANKKADGEVRQPQMKLKFADALLKAPGQTLSTAEGTWWGALNAVTYVIDHETGRSRDGGLRNAWVGYAATIKRDALKIALERAS